MSASAGERAGGWTYRFPEMARIPDLDDQTVKVVEEAVETQRAVFEWKFHEAAVEAMDVIHAAETLLRFLDGRLGADLDAAYEEVVAKNRARGYYEEAEAE